MNAIRTITIVGKTEGVAAATASLEKMAAGQDAVAVSSDRAAGSTLSVERQLAKLQTRIDPTYRSMQMLAQAEREISLAANQGLVSLARQTELMGLAEAKFKGEAAGIAGMVGSMKGMLEMIGFFAAFEAAMKIHEMVNEVVHGSAELVHMSEILGVTTKNLQEMHFAAGRLHISTEELDTALTRFSKNLGDASRGGGELYKILEANHVKVSGDLKTDFVHFADLIENTSDAEQKNLLIMTAFGRGAAELGPMFERGGAGIAMAMDEADRMGAIISDDSLQRLATLDKQWNAISITLGVAFKTAVIGVVLAFAEMQKSIQSALDGPLGGFLEWTGREIEGMTLLVKLALALAGAMNSADNEKFNRQAATINELFSNRMGAAGIPGQKGDADKGAYTHSQFLNNGFNDPFGWSPNTPAKATVLPPGPKQSNPYEESIKSLQKQKVALQAQIATFNQASGAVAAYTKRLELENAATQAGIAITPEMRKQIDNESEAYGRLTQQVQHLNDVQQATQFLSQQLFDVFMGLINHTNSLEDSFKRLALAIGQAVLQAALLGNGPLAGVMGMSTASGGGGGIISMVVGGLLKAVGVGHTGGMVGYDNLQSRYVHPAYFDDAPRFATGGIVGGEMPIIAHVGEEILRRDDPRHRLNGGSGGSHMVFEGAVINVLGDASENTLALIRQALASHEKKLSIRVAALVRNSIIGNNKLQSRFIQTNQ